MRGVRESTDFHGENTDPAKPALLPHLPGVATLQFDMDLGNRNMDKYKDKERTKSKYVIYNAYSMCHFT